tara:strand:- start:5123 stop:5500 length:378 start_codon:yes stop_codon:yes gene_type:complete
MQKKCSVCKEFKELTMFYRYKKAKDGLRYSCKSCSNDMNRRYRKNNPEKYAEWNKRRRNSEEAHKSMIRSRDLRKNLDDSYIRGLITMKNKLKPEDIPDIMVETWRANLQTKRALGLTSKLKGED